MKNITFINAGAGSGKTFHLTDTLTRIIERGDCKADEVILTTFTDKAAAEFKNKAREALLSSNKPDQANLLASAAMGSVHSVAFQLIQRYWYYLGIGVDQRVMPEDDKIFFLNQSLASVPGPDELDRLNQLTTTLNFVGDYYALNFDQWKNHLRTIIQLASNNCIEDLEACRTNSREEIDRVFAVDADWTIDNHEIALMLIQLLDVLRAMAANAANLGRIGKTQKLIRLNGNFGVPDYFAIGTLLEDLTNAQRAAIPSIESIRESLALIHRSPLLIDPMKEYVSLIFSLAERSLEELRLYKLEHRLIDFNDMEILLLKLLRIPEAALEIGSRYKMVLVDEFQDSSPIQVEIFVRLSEIVNHSYWVGDPKQAIYNFRGTDPMLIDAIIRELSIQDERNFNIENLGDSWRSRPQLVNLTNHIFTRALADQVRPEHIPLNPVRTALELPDDVDHKALQHWHFTDTSARGGSYANLGHHLASEIRQLLEDKNINVVDKNRSKYHPDPAQHHVVCREIRPEDIAILCRVKERIETYTGCLKKTGLEVAAEQKQLSDTAEMKLFTALLNFHLDPKDTLAKATIILFSTPGITTETLIDERLHYLYGPESQVMPEDPEADDFKERETDYYRYLMAWGQDNEMLARSEKIRARSVHLSLSSLVNELILLTGISDLVKRWDNPGPRKNNLETLKKLSASYEKRCLLMDMGASVRGFIEYLSVYNNPVMKQGAATGANAVNILTYHTSKGLEWPVVVLTDLDEIHLSDKKLINMTFFGVHLDNMLGINLDDPFSGKTIILVPWPFGSIAGGVPDDLRNRIIDTDRYKRISDSAEKEMKRLLYVGMTRARDILITTSYRNKTPNWMNDLAGHQNLNSNIAGLSMPVQDTDLFGTGDTISARVLDYSENTEYPATGQRSVTVYLKNGPTDQNSPMFRNPSRELAIPEATTLVVKDFGFRIQRGNGRLEDNITGDCLHSLFYLYRPGMPVEEFVPQARSVIENYGLAGDLAFPDHIHNAAINLYDYLIGTYGPAVKIYRELPMHLVEEGVVYSGSADLVWESADSLVLVDYKSYSGSRQHLTDPEHDHYAGIYSGQLKKYKEMIENGHPGKKPVKDSLIYYAVLGVIVRVG